MLQALLEAAAARFPISNDLLTASMGGSNKKKKLQGDSTLVASV